MSFGRLNRALKATEWARRPMAWAVRFRLARGPFRAFRGVPLVVLCRLLQIQILATEKIAR